MFLLVKSVPELMENDLHSSVKTFSAIFHHEMQLKSDLEKNPQLRSADYNRPFPNDVTGLTILPNGWNILGYPWISLDTWLYCTYVVVCFSELMCVCRVYCSGYAEYTVQDMLNILLTELVYVEYTVHCISVCRVY